MSARRLVCVGNQNLWVDPEDVSAVRLQRLGGGGHKVVVTLGSGVELTASYNVHWLDQNETNTVLEALDPWRGR